LFRPGTNSAIRQGKPLGAEGFAPFCLVKKRMKGNQMFIARWHIDAKFGQKQSVLDLMRRWETEIGRAAGTRAMNFSILTGSIGALEATIEVNHQVDSLAQLEAFFTAIGKNPAHAKWSKELEPHIVSGTAYWTILRVVEP
jgi:hypothetical protein